jgi:cellulose synthase/poly-beta-1,6-N-acetylglucosamine synthase-like glycosyltransferase
MIDPFDFDLEATSTLGETERLVLLRLVASGEITEAQMQDAVEIHRRNRTPLLDILGARGHIRPRDYAEHLAAISESGYAGGLLDSESLGLDAELVKQFSPAELTRYQFCPLSRAGSMVVVMAVDPNAPIIGTIVRRIVPDAEIVALTGSERDVTRLVDQVFQQDLLHGAVWRLRALQPTLSASQVFTAGQIVLFGGVLIAAIVAFTIQPWLVMTLAVLGVSCFYAASVLYKLLISLAGSLGHRTTREEMPRLPTSDLPVYSVLVPVYKEPEVVPTLLAALSRMDYPSEKLDVLLLMEQDDLTTIEAARAANPPSFFRFILIPPSQPRTKPKACNYGLSFCRGEYVTIYDAEDIPEPDQLRKAVHAFRNGPESLVCVQAALNYFNSAENYLTRMFTLEYSYWFDYMLPGLDRLGLPIPLGGTSNHFRVDRLRELGAWDPFNVTEDADLGIRASARGYTVGIIDSTTYEEANRAYKNWIRQRSRWIKGYMQTWLVHNRDPLRLLRRIGLRSWLSYQFFIGGTCLTFLINPLMWAFYLTWLLLRPAWLDEVFGGWVVYIALFNFLIGNMLGIYLNMLAVFRRRLFHLTPFALTNPLYWWMHSTASYMALWELFTKPFYWQKTTHGLTTVNGASQMLSRPQSVGQDVDPTHYQESAA